MQVRIESLHSKYFKNFHLALSQVAREEIYLEMIEAPAYEEFCKYHEKCIEQGFPNVLALVGDQVVGWVDVAPLKSVRMKHRGTLGMGIVPEFRGKGVGSLLMAEVIEQSRKIQLQKIELTVYAENLRAISLYRKFGFTPIGIINSFRIHNNKTFDAIMMEMFL